jgi:peroxiredoxin
VAIDVTGSDADARKYVAELKVTFRSLKWSWEAAGASYGVTGTPANFILDRDGRIVFVHEGYRGEAGVAQMARELDALLSQ